MSQRLWITPVEKRFTLTSCRGPFKFYKENGEITAADDSTYTFGEGTLQFTDSGSMVTVHAHGHSKSVFLMEICGKIVAAFILSRDRGLLVKHLNEEGGSLPIAFRDIAVIILMLPDKGPFSGFVSATHRGTNVSGPVYVKDLQSPRMFVPENLLIMYQHLRNAEQKGSVPWNKHTFERFDKSGTIQFKQIGNACRIFTVDEAMKWLEKSKKHTPIEDALRQKFSFEANEKSIITYPKQYMEYVNNMSKLLSFAERPQFDEGEVVDDDPASDCSDRTNSQDSSEFGQELGAVSLQGASYRSSQEPTVSVQQFGAMSLQGAGDQSSQERDALPMEQAFENLLKYSWADYMERVENTFKENRQEQTTTVPKQTDSELLEPSQTLQERESVTVPTDHSEQKIEKIKLD